MAEQLAARRLAASLRYTRFRRRRSLAGFALQPSLDGKLFEDLAHLALDRREPAAVPGLARVRQDGRSGRGGYWWRPSLHQRHFLSTTQRFVVVVRSERYNQRLPRWTLRADMENTIGKQPSTSCKQHPVTAFRRSSSWLWSLMPMDDID